MSSGEPGVGAPGEHPAYQAHGRATLPGATGANPTTRPLLRQVLTYGAVSAGFLVSGAVLSFLYGLDLGVTTALLAAAFAAIPLLVVVPTYLWLDRLEAEPWRYLLFTFGWGALIAPVGALFLNTGVEALFAVSGIVDDPAAATAVLVAPPVEEGLKGLAILLVVLLRRREFDGVVDGVVYAGMVGAGFAFSENIFYLGRSYAAGGIDTLNQVWFVRALLSPFAHPLFTACTGIGLGIAVAVTRTLLGRVSAGLGGFAAAVLLHGIWNLTAVTGTHVAGYFLFQVPLFVAYIVLIVVLRHREGRLIGQYLMPYADAGWFTHQEVGMLVSVRARRWARDWAKGHGGRASLAAMRAFQDSASDLALLRSRIAHGSAEPTAAARERLLLAAIVANRQEFVGSPVG